MTQKVDPLAHFRTFLAAPCEMEPLTWVDSSWEETLEGGSQEPTAEELWAGEEALPIQVATKESLTKDVTALSPLSPLQEEGFHPPPEWPFGDMGFEPLPEWLWEEEEFPGVKGSPLKLKNISPLLVPGDKELIPGPTEHYDIEVPVPEGCPVLPPDTPEQKQAILTFDRWEPLTEEQNSLIEESGIEEVEDSPNDLLEELVGTPVAVFSREEPFEAGLIEEVMEKLNPNNEALELSEESRFQSWDQNTSLLVECEKTPTDFMTVFRDSHTPEMEIEGKLTVNGSVTIRGDLKVTPQETPSITRDTVYGLPMIEGSPAPFAVDCWIVDKVLKGRTFELTTTDDLHVLRQFTATANYALKG